MTKKWRSAWVCLCAFVVVFSCLTMDVQAEETSSADSYAGNYACGSYTMMESIEKNQNRPYLDYFAEVGSGDKGVSGLLRRTIFKAYLMPGETLYLGSSVDNSKFDENGNLTNSVTGCDIVVVAPDGTRTSIDVVKNGVGYIASPSQENAGPTIPGIHENGGYTAIPYEAQEEGVYEILFQSVNGDGNNPTTVKKEIKWIQGSSNVAAWNATVIGTDGTYKSGRVFSKMLAINMGSQNAQFASPLYVQTADGYIYKMKCFDARPWGFVFYANNRGLVDVDTDYNLYQSYRYDTKTLRDLGVDTHNPNTPDTKENITFNIFLEEPSEELIGKLYPKAFVPSPAENFQFIGTEAEDKTHTGCGGYFTFDTTNASSATVTLDMTKIGRGTVTISNVVAPGNNKFYWDGLDEYGNIVPTGLYDTDQIKVSVTTYAGDYHFPMLDVEMMPKGITIERINPLYQEVVEDGKIVEKDVTAEYEADKFRVYYNNPSGIGDGMDASAGVSSEGGALKYGTENGSVDLGNNTAINIWTYASGDFTTVQLENPIEVVEDAEHTNLTGRIFFDYNKDGQYDHANQDYVISDIPVTLTYYAPEGDEWVQKTMSTTTDAAGRYYFFGIPTDPDATHPATITVVNDGGYEVTSGEKVTNSNVQVVTPEGKKETQTAGSQYETKGTAVQTMLIGKDSRYIPELRFSDVGISFTVRENPMVVRKVWTEDSATDSNQPDSVTVYAEVYYEVDGQHISLRNLSYQLNKSNFWQFTDYTIPETVVDADGVSHSVKVRLVKEEYKTRDGQSYTYEFKEDADYSGQTNPYATFMSAMTVEGKQHVYTVTNALKNKTLKVRKVDAVDNTKTLSGAEMTLWNLTVFTDLPNGLTEANKTRTLGTGTVYQSGSIEYLVNDGKIYVKSATATTGDDGIATFPNALPANSYIITESQAPTGYYQSTTLYPVTLVAGDTEKTVTVTNEKMPTAQFDLNGAAGTVDSISKASGTEITLPDAPTREHYEFKGWKVGETTYAAGTKYTLTADVTFTAQWEQVSTDPSEVTPTAAAYRVEYYKENPDGTYSVVTGDTQLLIDAIGKKVTAPAKTYPNYTERTTPDESTGTIVAPTAGADGAPVILVLKRYYNLNEHTVSFDLNGGTGTADDQTAKYGTTITLPEAPTREHYEFKGWKVGDTTYAAGDEFTVNGDATLTAQWEQVSTDPSEVTPTAAAYRVEYYKENPDGTYSEVTEDTRLLTDAIGKEVTAPAKTYPNYTERTTPDESTGTIVAPTTGADGVPVILVLKRYYNLNEHTVSFDLNGGTGTADDQTAKYGTTITLPDAPTKEGYMFEGWKLDDTLYAAGDDFTVDGDVTLKAQWKKIPDEPTTPENPTTPDKPGGSTSGTTISGGSGSANSGTPDTGDHGQAMLWLGVLGVCGAVLLRMMKKAHRAQ